MIKKLMPKNVTVFGLVLVSINLFIAGAITVDAPSNVINTFWAIDAVLVAINQLGVK